MRCGRAGRRLRCGKPCRRLGLEGRIGVNTGEVLAGTEERLATGDAVNVAARLEQAANPGEVLVGVATFALVGGAVDVGEERMLELKGKREPVAVRPLLEVFEAAERSHVSRFVGRERELRQLTDAWERALDVHTASSYRWSATPAWASPVSWRRRCHGSMRAPCAAVACPTGKASRIGP